MDCGLLLACAALLRLTPSLCLQVHYSCMLGVGRRELRRCLCICVRVQHGASGVEIVRITLGNYHVEPQSREARLWLVLIIVPVTRTAKSVGVTLYSTIVSTALCKRAEFHILAVSHSRRRASLNGCGDCNGISLTTVTQYCTELHYPTSTSYDTSTAPHRSLLSWQPHRTHV